MGDSEDAILTNITYCECECRIVLRETELDYLVEECVQRNSQDPVLFENLAGTVNRSNLWTYTYISGSNCNYLSISGGCGVGGARVISDELGLN